MTAAVRRSPLTPDLDPPAPAAALEALARRGAPEAFEAELGPVSEAEPAASKHRRGPLRPQQLLPARARFNGSAPARTFQSADGAMIGALAAVICGMLQPGGLLAATVADVLPYLVCSVLVIWGLVSFGAYRFEARERLSGHLVRTAAAFLPAAALLSGLSLWWGWRGPGAAQAGLWLALCFAGVYLAHVGWWMTVEGWRVAGRLTPNIVVVGATRNAERLIDRLLESREAHVLGVFDDRLARAPDAVRGVPVLGDTRALATHRLTPYVDRIVVTVPASAQGRVSQIIERLRVLPNEISLFLDFDPDGLGSLQATMLARLASAPLAQLSGGPRNAARAFWKRVQDLVIGSAALVVALPLMAVIALAVRLDSPGPILFRQRRHGFNNEEIVVWKFRSMRRETTDATASRQVSVGDERVTRVGRVIRRTSLDELPQLLNVLTGEMSLVGPRPHAIGMKTGDIESARLVGEYAHRHRLKPGITGWAAIKGSRGPVDTPDSVRRRVALDVEYIERQSFWLDLYILAMTLPCLLGDRAVVR